MNTNRKPNFRRNNDNHSSRKPRVAKRPNNIPEHIWNITLVLNNNAEIRRFTSLAMINALRAANQINENDKVYIKFDMNKFSIIVNGLAQEQRYNNNFFIEAFGASFVAFAHSAEKLINTFCEIENREIDNENVAQAASDIENDDNSPVEEETEE